MAQALCMKPSALPRCSAGQVSDTSAAPLAHSPPMPIPSRMRNTASCHDVLGEPACGREHRVDEDAAHQRPRSSEPIGNDAEDHAADRRRDEGDRAEKSGDVLGDVQIRPSATRARGRTASRRTRRASTRGLRRSARDAPPGMPARHQPNSPDVSAAAPVAGAWRVTAGDVMRVGDRRGRTVSPSRSSPSRRSRVSSSAPGVSPCVQSVSTLIGKSDPSRATTRPSRTMRMDRRTTSAAS